MRIERPIYLDQLIRSRGNGFIKIITGIRRCGKSYLLKTLLISHLIACSQETYFNITIQPKPDNGGYVGDMNFGCYDNPFLGKACISFNGFGFTEEYNDCIPNGTDMSELVENGYCLEFAIKNSNPSLSLDFKFSSITNREMWTLQTYCYRYEGSEHNCSDEWELVRIPLSSFIDWTDKNRNYWEMIDIFELQQMSSASFYLDEIRIRKIK